MRYVRRRSAVTLVAVAAGLGGCGADSVAMPPVEGVADYQLGGAYDVLADGSIPTVVVRDASAAALAGAYNVCYVNGFQTQPGDAERWRELPDVLLRGDDGEPVVDPDWPDEYVLDPSTSEQRSVILDRLAPVIEGCADAGYDAVEIDNLDTWTRFDAIDPAGTADLARAYVDVAHGAGLAIAQKNAAQAARTARDDWGFDFAVAEECAAWDECGAYGAAYGDHVLEIEYPDALAEAGLSFADVCARSDRAPLTILRDRELVVPSEPGYVYDAC